MSESVQMQVLEALRVYVDGLCAGYPLTIGALPERNALCMVVSTGRCVDTTLAQGMTVTLDVTLNMKHERQLTAMDVLCGIHEAFNALVVLPAGDCWQMIAVRTTGAPGYIDREDDGQWLYGSALAVSYCTEG